MGTSHVARWTALAVAIAIASAPAQAARLDYDIDVGAERNDNIRLAPVDPIGKTYLRSGIGWLFRQQSSTLQADVSGRVDYRRYDDARLADRVEGELAGRLNWVMVPERLHFVVEDSLAIQSVDTFAPDSPDNRQQVNVVSLGPTFYFRLGQTVRGQAEARFIDSSAEETEEFNSKRTALALRAIKDIGPTSLLSANLQGQRVEFDQSLLARDYDRYEAYARYARTLANFDLGIEAGSSRISYRDGETRSDPLLRIDATWRAGGRSQVRLLAATLVSDAAADALGGLVPGTAVPDTLLIDNSQVSGSAYNADRLQLGYTFAGTRMSVTVTPYIERRDYIEAAQLDEDARGARLEFGWRLPRSVALNLYASQETIEYDAIAGENRLRHVGIGIEKRLTRHWAGRLDWAHYKRGTPLVGDVSQDTVYLSFRYSSG